MADLAVQLQNLHKTYNAGSGKNEPIQAVHDVTLDIDQGEFFTLLGPSGCGKTTTLRLIAGFEEPTSGEIYVQGKSVTKVPANQRPVNMVFQNYALFPHLSVADNIGFGLSVKGTDKSQQEGKVREVLELVQLQGYQKRRPAELSGGQQQRVALARALINEPAVLLLDEPLGALDLKLRKAMQLELKDLQTKLGVTFLYVTHDQEEALTMSDRIAVMSQGRVLQIGTPHKIYEQPINRFVADFIGESNFLTGITESISKAELAVRVGDQIVPASPNINGLAVGATVSLAIRPEKIDLLTEGQGLIRGKLVDIVYIGTDTRYIAELPNGTRLTARRQNDGRRNGVQLEVGQSVGLSWNPEDANPLPD